jgi:hypothetical protein
MGHAPPGNARDFDFLAGEWTLFCRRLRARLAGCDEWEEFTGTLAERAVLGGQGSLGEFRAVFAGREVIGLPLRLYDPQRDMWRLHWIDNVRGEIEPPLWGRFVDGRGIFLGEDLHQGQRVRVRVVWRALDDGAAAYEQAYSADDGVTWETNWTIRLERR